MKKQILLVCCDIEGTISYAGVTDNVLLDNLMYIDYIRKFINVDETLLSFVSTNNRKSIIENYEKFKNLIYTCNKYYDTNIVLGPQYSSCHCHNPINKEITKTLPTKYQQIKNLCYYLENIGTDIKEIMFIDDYPFSIPNLLINDPYFKEKITNSILSMTFISKTDFHLPDKVIKNESINLYNENCDNFVQKCLKKRLNRIDINI